MTTFLEKVSLRPMKLNSYLCKQKGQFAGHQSLTFHRHSASLWSKALQAYISSFHLTGNKEWVSCIFWASLSREQFKQPISIPFSLKGQTSYCLSTKGSGSLGAIAPKTAKNPYGQEDGNSQ